ncbi:MAG: ATP-binding cassette domain-containing protein [Tessaracoccus sp.]|uniref:ATP-binding cassette domain-containing protein n=1 Tax=Tessaracoccus sp. TaxID=1971211 RepID=UPI001EB87A4E|nr:ATP-binding cassette domain-containing protein [Tessaracoccus sp.]MBK7820238.1 ATP-binding cassette domain-containing protein [Tessaracoccus sp.]
MKLYSVTDGVLRVHGQSVEEVPTGAAPRGRCRVPGCEPLQRDDPENLAYGLTEVTDEQLRAAATRANAMGFIDKLKGGFDTQIGERGIKLSGGQKQRLAVARALLKDAPILILDEATSSLDTKSERAVQAGLDELMEGRTTLIVAHRLPRSHRWIGSSRCATAESTRSALPRSWPRPAASMPSCWRFRDRRRRPLRPSCSATTSSC